MNIDKKELKKLDIKLPKELGKISYISNLPITKDLSNLIFYRFILIIIIAVFSYLAYEYLYLDNYHKPIWKHMNDGRVVNIESSKFILYIIAIFWSLKHFIFLKMQIKVVGDKAIVIYTFRLTRKYSSEHIGLYKDKEFKIEKYIKNNPPNQFEEELLKQYNIYNITRRHAR